MQTVQKRLWGVLVVVICCLTACAGNNEELDTLVAQNATLGTENANVRGTSTAVAAQLQVTREFFATQAQGASDRQLFIVRTLSALGEDISGVELITPQIVPPTPIGGGDIAPVTSAGGGITLVAPTPLQFGSTPTMQAAVPTSPAAAATIDPAQPNLSSASVSSAVGANDCATASSTTFDVSTPAIYAVGTANNFPAGFSLTFTWRRDGEVLLTDSFTWQSAVNGACIWYYVTSEDFEFLPGSYTVSFDSNGLPVGSPVTFSLTSAGI